MAELIRKDSEIRVSNPESIHRLSHGEEYSKHSTYAEDDGEGGTFYHTFIRRFTVVVYDESGIELEDATERQQAIANGDNVSYGWDSETDVVTHLDKDEVDDTEIDSAYSSVLGTERYITEAEAREVARGMCEAA